MLYVNSRDKAETFTAFRVLSEEIGPDNGVVVPFRLQPFTREQICDICSGTFHEAVATVLNYFFNTRLEGWGLELSTGRNVSAIYELNSKMIMAELWHSPDNTYAYLEKTLYLKLGLNQAYIPFWARVAIRTAVLFGVFAQLNKQGIETLDVAGVSSDSSTCLAPFYAKILGLPVGNILIGCDEESGLWELIYKGQFPASGTAAHTAEMMIYTLFGEEEAAKFAECRNKKRTYSLSEDQLIMLNDGLSAAVISNSRLDIVVDNVFRTNAYRISPKTAIAYSAIQDNRAKTGECKEILLFADGYTK